MRPSTIARAALAAAFAAPLLPAPAAACSKSFMPWRSAATATFIGTATADTVLAGAGAVRYTLADGHHGPGYGQARPIHGQIVAIEQLDARTRRLLPAGTARVVIVPWDYGADCTPTPWANSARWTAPGAAGLFVAELRDRAHWAGDLPTLDVHEPSWFPYPGRMRALRGRGDYLTPLTAEELLGLYEATPTLDEQDRDFGTAIAPVLAWARQHPDLARREPAASALRSLRYEEEQRRAAAIVPPMAGTYRLEVSLDGDAPRTVWARTWSHADGPVLEGRGTAAGPDADDPLRSRRSEEYSVVLAGATDPATLPDSARPYQVEHVGYLRIVERPDADTAWRGTVELDVLRRVLPADSALHRFVKAAFDEFGARYRADLPEPAQATFTRAPDGTVRVEQRTALADGRTLVIRGVRVSDAVIRDAPPGR